MPPAGFEPAISASERPQTYPLDPAANGIDQTQRYQHKKELHHLQLTHIWNILSSCDLRDWYSIWSSMFVLFSTKGLYFTATWLRIEESCLRGTQSYTDRRTRTEITAVPGGGIVNHLLKFTWTIVTWPIHAASSHFSLVIEHSVTLAQSGVVFLKHWQRLEYSTVVRAKQV